MKVDKVIINSIGFDIVNLYSDNAAVDKVRQGNTCIHFCYKINNHWFESSTELLTHDQMSIPDMQSGIMYLLNSGE